jgi:hypothetical protein
MDIIRHSPGWFDHLRGCRSRTDDTINHGMCA